MIYFEKDEREKIEEQMAIILNRMMDLEREIRLNKMEIERRIKLDKTSEEQLQKYREQLEKLTNEYASGYNLYVVKEG